MSFRFVLRPLLLTGLLLLGTGLFAQSEEEAPAVARHRALLELERAERILATKPDNVDALAAKAGATTVLGIRIAAYATINRLEELAPEYPRINEWREALEFINPDATEVVVALASASAEKLGNQETEAAADLLRIAELILPDVTEPGFGPWTLRVIRGYHLAADGHYDLARADYEKAKGPDGVVTAEARVGLGRVFLKTGDFEAALASLATVPSDAGRDYQYSRYWTAKTLAARYEKSRSFTDAEQAYDLFSALADADPHDEDYSRDRDALRDLVSPAARARLHPSARVALVQVKALHAKGQVADARQQLDLLLLRHPRFADGYAFRATLTSDAAAGQRDLTIAKALRSPPSASSAGNSDQLEAADHAITLRPYASDPLVQRARLLLELRDPDSTNRALTDARAAVALDAFDPQAYAVLAEALEARNRHLEYSEIERRERNRAEATAAADQAVALAPDDAGLLQWRGDFAAEYGLDITTRPAQAMRFYTKALRSDPASIGILLKRAQTAGQADRKAEAVTDYLEILRLAPGYTQARYNLGLRQLSLARFADAIATFAILDAQIAAETDGASGTNIEIAQLTLVARAGAGENCVDRAQLLLNQSGWSGNASAQLANLRQIKPHSRELDRLAQLKPAKQ